jgi:hypothetical protein
MMMENLVEKWLAGDNEVLGENNLLQRHFVHLKSHTLCPGANPGSRSGKPAINDLRYGTVKSGWRGAFSESKATGASN